MQVPVVKIKSDNSRGYKLINEASFDPNVHELFDAPAAPVEVDMTDEELRDALTNLGIRVTKSRSRAWMLSKYNEALDI